MTTPAERHLATIALALDTIFCRTPNNGGDVAAERGGSQGSPQQSLSGARTPRTVQPPPAESGGEISAKFAGGAWPVPNPAHQQNGGGPTGPSPTRYPTTGECSKAKGMEGRAVSRVTDPKSGAEDRDGNAVLNLRLDSRNSPLHAGRETGLGAGDVHGPPAPNFIDAAALTRDAARFVGRE